MIETPRKVLTPKEAYLDLASKFLSVIEEAFDKDRDFLEAQNYDDYLSVLSKAQKLGYQYKGSMEIIKHIDKLEREAEISKYDL